MKVRELGITIGQLPSGYKNCITDIEGVSVGHVTLDYPLNDAGDAACTGVTAILPHPGNLFREKVTAASYVLNGFGKTTGLIQVDELGVIESPIMLTNTFGVPNVAQGTLEYLLEQNDEIGISTGTVNIVVGECNDSHLNSIRHFPVNLNTPLKRYSEQKQMLWKKELSEREKVWFVSAIKEELGPHHVLLKIRLDKSILSDASYLVTLARRTNF